MTLKTNGRAGIAVFETAPAKVNLWLRVLGRRRDGYHDLYSLVVFSDLADELRFAPSGALSLTVTGPFADAVPTDSRNLVLRAAEALAGTLARPPAVAIELHKVLPVTAGIGGGSADAAATLRGLSRLWKVGPGDLRVAEIAARLGADVPVCLHGRPAIIVDTGAVSAARVIMEPLPAVLVNPGVEMATSDVFNRLEAPLREPWQARHERGHHNSGGSLHVTVETILDQENDLTGPAVEAVPVVADVLDAIRNTEGCRLSRMSGSGATCFGLYDTEDAARAAAKTLAKAHADWWVAPALLNGTRNRPVTDRLTEHDAYEGF